jgi:glycerate 2-kinase
VAPRDLLRRMFEAAVDAAAPNACVPAHRPAAPAGRTVGVGGGKAAVLVTLLISDVPGDDPSVIGSGPTVPDDTTRADAQAVLARYGIDAPLAVAAWLRNPASETPKPGDPAFARARTVTVATPQAALEAAAAVARVMAGVARHCARYGQPARPPCVLVSGGETTVTLRGQGRGGRNAEFLLACAVALDGHPGVHALAADTDGIDRHRTQRRRPARPQSLPRVAALGMRARDRLADNDGNTVFQALQNLVTTGPTRTNVNDLRAVLIQSSSEA